MSTSASLKQLLQTRSRVTQIVGVGSGFEASLAVKHGADAIWVSSLCLSLHELLPDEQTVSSERVSRVSSTVRRSLDVPVLVDAGSGGAPAQLLHLLRECECATATGICIEDARAPKRNSLGAGHNGLVEVSEFRDKLRLLTRGRESQEFIVVGRTEALIAGLSVEAALERAEAYISAGIDALFLHSRTKPPVLRFARAWNTRLPLIVCPTRFPDLTIAEAADNGIAAVIYANQGMRACLTALERTFAVLLKSGSASAVEESVAPFDLLLRHTEGCSRARVDSDYCAGLLRPGTDNGAGDDGPGDGREEQPQAHGMTVRASRPVRAGSAQGHRIKPRIRPPEFSFVCSNARSLAPAGQVVADGVEPAEGAVSEGDLLLCEVIEVGGYAEVEDLNGWEMSLAPKLRFVGVAGCRDSERSLSGVPPSSGVGDLHLLNQGGLVGIADPPPVTLAPLTRLRCLGRVTHRGRALNTLDGLRAARAPATLALPGPTIVVLASAPELGKTTLVDELIRASLARGLTPLPMKIAGSGRFRDLLSYRRAGAEAAFDFVDFGLPSTYTDPMLYGRFLRLAGERVAAAEPRDLSIIEVGGDALAGNFDTFLRALDEATLAAMNFVVIAADVHALLGFDHCFGDILRRGQWWYRPPFFANERSFGKRKEQRLPGAPGLCSSAGELLALALPERQTSPDPLGGAARIGSPVGIMADHRV